MHDPMVVAWKIRNPWPSRSTAVGRNWYFRPLVTIWHVEPGGRDSGSVCKHSRQRGGRWAADGRWRWHVWHWHIQISPLQEIRARLFDRCALCGRKGRPNISHQWDGPGVGWRKWRSRQGLYHDQCSSLVSLRRTKESDETLIRHLFAGFAVHLDMDESDLLAMLTDPNRRGLDFAEARRLTHLLGYERDEQYRLVRGSGRG